MIAQAQTISALLLDARRTRVPLPWGAVLPLDRAGAYAIQDATLAGLGPTGGWKVGAKGPQFEPICAPLPASGVLQSGAPLTGEAWRLRGIEVELGLRVGRDPRGCANVLDAFDAVVPVIEVVETRLADWRTSNPLAQLADLQSHGALIVGEPLVTRLDDLDLRTLSASLSFDGTPVATTVGGNPAVDLARLLNWLVDHCAQRGTPLLPRQIVTTGSCTGMHFADECSLVQARIVGIGTVELSFA